MMLFSAFTISLPLAEINSQLLLLEPNRERTVGEFKPTQAVK